MSSIGSPMDEEIQVAYLGPEATYTHQAALKTFVAPWYRLYPEGKIEDIFAAVASGRASRGIVPFENSTNGAVNLTLDCFADLAGKYADLVVINEAYVTVKHCISGFPASTDVASLPAKLSSGSLGEEGATGTGGITRPGHIGARMTSTAVPYHDLSHIEKLYSHPQAWGQCETFLGSYLPNVARDNTGSTSGAAEKVAADRDISKAAISSKLAATTHGLAVLAENIHDADDNTTRFLVIRRLSEYHDIHQRTHIARNVEREQYKTLITFTVEHTKPGALSGCLDVFKKHDINLTSLNTRPSGEGGWKYIFFAEFRGYKRTDGHRDPETGELARGKVNEALDDLSKVARSWRWVGSWEDMEFQAAQQF